MMFLEVALRSTADARTEFSGISGGGEMEKSRFQTKGMQEYGAYLKRKC